MTIHDSAAEPKLRPAVPSLLLMGGAALIVALLAATAFNTHRLVIEQQRASCFARLAWLAPGEEERPAGVDRASSARMCESDSPLIEYQDQS